MKQRFIIWLKNGLLLSIFALLLSGCGGEDSSETGVGSEAGLNVSMSVNGVVTNTLSSTQQATIYLKALSETFVPLTGVLITLELEEEGLVSLDKSSVVTDSSGLASFNLIPSTSFDGTSASGTVVIIPEDSALDELGIQRINFTVTQVDSAQSQQNSPYQANFSLQADVYNPEALNCTEPTVNLTAILTKDDGTRLQEIKTIKFMAEDGAIDEACTTSNGECSVEWTCNGDQIVPTDHRVTVMAYVSGSENFKDKNANGLYESSDGEPFDNRGSSGLRAIYINTTGNSNQRRLFTVNEVFDEPFVDTNNNGIFDEPFVDANTNGQYDFGENFTDYNQNGLRDGALTVSENQFIDLNGDTIYQGSGYAASESFQDISPANNTYGLGEPFFDRQDIFSPNSGLYDAAYVNDTDGDGIADTNYTSPVDNSVISAPNGVVRGEAFTDVNADGVFNGPGFEDLSEPFLDKNEDGIYQEADESYIDTDGNGAYSQRNGRYDGVNCAENDSLCGSDSVMIRRSIVLVRSSSNANVIVTVSEQNNSNCAVGDILYSNRTNQTGCGLTTPAIGNGGYLRARVYVSDTAGQTMPNETSVNVEADIGEIQGGGEYEFENSSNDAGQYSMIQINDDDSAETNPVVPGELTVTVETSAGSTTSVTIPYSLD